MGVSEWGWRWGLEAVKLFGKRMAGMFLLFLRVKILLGCESEEGGKFAKMGEEELEKGGCVGTYLRIIRNRGLLSWESGCWVG